jgi:NifU-like protein
MTAAADVICGWLRNKQLGELHGLPESELQELIERELGSYPAARQQCADVVLDALRAAMAAYRQDRINEFRGETALICTCFGVSEETVLNSIAACGLTDVDEVSRVCRAGSGCGSCRMLIQELIDSSKL